LTVTTLYQLVQLTGFLQVILLVQLLRDLLSILLWTNHVRRLNVAACVLSCLRRSASRSELVLLQLIELLHWDSLSILLNRYLVVVVVLRQLLMHAHRAKLLLHESLPLVQTLSWAYRSLGDGDWTLSLNASSRVVHVYVVKPFVSILLGILAFKTSAHINSRNFGFNGRKSVVNVFLRQFLPSSDRSLTALVHLAHLGSPHRSSFGGKLVQVFMRILQFKRCLCWLLLLLLLKLLLILGEDYIRRDSLVKGTALRFLDRQTSLLRHISPPKYRMPLWLGILSVFLTRSIEQF
jgi:hypothetical protein